MITEEQYKMALEVVENYLSQVREDPLDEEAKLWFKDYSKLIGITKDDLLFNIASVRLLNVLKINREYLNIDIEHSTPIKELSKVSLKLLNSCKRCGTKTLWELKAICYYAQVKLKV